MTQNRCFGVGSPGGIHPSPSLILLIIVVVLLLVSAFPAWPHSANQEHFPSGGLGLLLIVLVVLGQIRRIATALLGKGVATASVQSCSVPAPHPRPGEIGVGEHKCDEATWRPGA